MGTFLRAFGAVLIILLALLLLIGFLLSEPPQTFYLVQYRVTGTARTAEITIRTPQGTEQHTLPIPYTLEYTFKRGQFAYISAQNEGRSGHIMVELIADGVVLKRAMSGAEFGIASTNWRVGSDR